jgi:hypothetical protein
MSYQLSPSPHKSKTSGKSQQARTNETLRQSDGVTLVTAAATDSHINCTQHSTFGMCHTFTQKVIKFHDGEFNAVNSTTLSLISALLMTGTSNLY